MKLKLFLIISILVLIFSFISYFSISYSLSKFGSSGQEVKQIQQKLKAWGYYNGSVDGIFGSKTLEAVKRFQRKNGLTADGIVGSKTLAALGINSSSNSGKSSNNTDVNLLVN